jgi:hypothetical protein
MKLRGGAGVRRAGEGGIEGYQSEMPQGLDRDIMGEERSEKAGKKRSMAYINKLLCRHCFPV